MYAQFTYLDGPRSAELVAASERAGRERIKPALEADDDLRDQMVALFACRRPDGGEVIVSVMRTRDALVRAGRLILATELLPGEDPALLPGPDRVEVLEVIEARVPSGVSA